MELDKPHAPNIRTRSSREIFSFFKRIVEISAMKLKTIHLEVATILDSVANNRMTCGESYKRKISNLPTLPL